MKKHWILLTILSLTLVLGAAFANEGQERQNRQERRSSRAQRRPSFYRCLMQLDLTDEQIAGIDLIRKETIESLKEAETPEEARSIIEGMHEAMKALLDEAQLAALEECLQPEKPVTCMDQIDLTQEQKDEIHAIRQEAIAAIKEADSPRKARDIIEQMHQLMEEVLTTEQLEALRECLRPKKRVNCMDQIDLTPVQIAAIDAARQAAMEALEEAETREEIREIMDLMHDDIMAVLDDGQIAALQECRDAQRKGPGGPGKQLTAKKRY